MIMIMFAINASPGTPYLPLMKDLIKEGRRKDKLVYCILYSTVEFIEHSIQCYLNMLHNTV